MSLPVQVVNRLFSRLGATYGAQWDRMWGAVPEGDMKSAWAHELSGYAHRLDAVAWALENLPERCPNVIEFRNICRQAPAPEVPRLPEPQADPARLAAELSKLGQVRRNLPEAPGRTDWARRIIERIKAGEKVNRTVALFAKQALGLA